VSSAMPIDTRMTIMIGAHLPLSDCRARPKVPSQRIQRDFN
jgi:hypothetical protein